MPRKFLIFIFLLTLGEVWAQSVEPLVVDSSFTSKSFFESLEVFDFQSIPDAQSVFSQKDKLFKSHKGIARFKADNKYHWLKLEIEGKANKTLVLDYQQIYVDDIRFYLFAKDSLVKQSKSSHQLSYQNKPFPGRFHAFSFEINPGLKYTLLIRVKNEKKGYTNRTFINLSTQSQYQSESDFYLLQMSLAAGCLLIVSLLSLGFFAYSRKSIYLSYGAYSLAFLVYIFSTNGVVNEFFSPNSFLAKPYFNTSLLLLIIVFHTHYIFKFFKISDLNIKKLNTVVNVFYGLCFLEILEIVIRNKSLIPLLFFYVMLFFWIITFLIIAFSKKQKEPILYLIASGPIFLNFIIVVLSISGAISISPVFFYYPHIPLTLEALGLGLALFYQFYQERKLVEAELEHNRLLTTHKILLAQEEERQKLARDLHDDLGGSLSVLNRELDEFNSDHNGKISDSVKLTQKIVEDLRLISHHLMPSSFTEKGLVKVLQETIELANRQNKIQFRLITEGPEKRLHPDREINTYRIVKELINNILKHSKATEATVQLIFFDVFLYISVEDNGCGFDISRANNLGIGFKNINLRAGFLKAQLSMESGINGTLISLEIPYNDPED